MTRQHIRFSALRSIFWGTLLLFLDFDLNFRFGFSFTLPLLPNCIGFWLVARGTRSLAADRPSLGLLGPFWLALGLWSLQQFFPGLSPHIPGALSLLAALVRMYADFQLFTDLAGLAEDLLPVPTSCSGCGSSPGPWLPLRRQVDNPLICPGEGFAGGASSSPADCAAPSVMPQGPVPDRHVGAHCAPLHRKNAPLGKEFLLQGRVLFFKTAYR